MTTTDRLDHSSDEAGTTFEFALPSLGADMDAGRVVEWRVAVGDMVHRGDVIAVVETEKSDLDVEIWQEGTLEELLVPLGEEIPVGTPIARLRVGGGDTSPEPAPPSTPSPPAAPSTPSRVPASPLARRRAAELGVDLATVHGSGPGGAVVVADLPDRGTAREPTLPPPRPTATRPASTAAPRSAASISPERGMRGLIAERMARANREIPHYHLARDVDVGALQDWLAGTNAERPVRERLLPAAAYVKAVGVAAAAHPELNGFWIDEGFRPGTAVNVAMAISLRSGGLVTPHVPETDRRSTDEIMSLLRTFVAEARTGTLRASWMTGATITLTNLGDHGADLVHGVISPPQVALVGIGRVVARPWVVDGAVVPRPVATLTLAADHRATDGVTASRFLDALARALENPEEL